MAETTTESANDRFERLAEAFYADTGKMAPGKDVPAACGADDYDLRCTLWTEWLAGRKRASEDSTNGG